MESLIQAAALEVAALYKRAKTILPKGEDRQQRQDALQFGLGLAQRLLFSALVDADWTDTASFMGSTPLPSFPSDSQRQATWDLLSGRMEGFIRSMKAERPIDLLRQEISGQCPERRTASSRRYLPAVCPHRRRQDLLRPAVLRGDGPAAECPAAVLLRPYKSITRQNADNIRRALGAEYVLEHHSDVLFEPDQQDQREQWLALSQRWQGSPVICTTMVQLLDTLFAAPRQNVRRLAALAGSVLLLDEVQASPCGTPACSPLALNTLVHLFGCTVILCTATQPDLTQIPYPLQFSRDMDLVPDYQARFQQFRRTRIVPPAVPGEQSLPAIADFVAGLLEENRSILVILNTKGTVNRLFDALAPLMPPTAPPVLPHHLSLPAAPGRRSGQDHPAAPRQPAPCVHQHPAYRSGGGPEL